jgi:hypothetical protein
VSPLSVVTTDFDWSEDEEQGEDDYTELSVDALLSRAVPSSYVVIETEDD